MQNPDFIHHYDEGHGWLVVTTRSLEAVGLTEADITPYSYRRGDLLALEEDCDAGTFIEAWKAKHGRDPVIGSREDHSIRGWADFGTKQSVWA